MFLVHWYRTFYSLKIEVMAATKKSGSKSGPCWEGYKKVGMKKKGGKSVPDCVPTKSKSKSK
jgi:hypothetical protein